MEIQFYGANCIKITTKKSSIVIDDNLKELGLKTVVKPQDILLLTNASMPQHEAVFVANMPGEYEFSDVSVVGLAARSHMGPQDDKSAVIYKIMAGNSTVVVLGHIFPDLSDQQLERIGMVDVLIAPVGNNGYTMDAIGALSLVKKIEPKVIIPTHYGDDKIKYEVPQQDLENALQVLSMEPTERTAKFKVKNLEASDNAQLVILEY